MGIATLESPLQEKRTKSDQNGVMRQTNQADNHETKKAESVNTTVNQPANPTNK
jgi:hypothetical protein